MLGFAELEILYNAGTELTIEFHTPVITAQTYTPRVPRMDLSGERQSDFDTMVKALPFALNLRYSKYRNNFLEQTIVELSTDEQGQPNYLLGGIRFRQRSPSQWWRYFSARRTVRWGLHNYGD